MRTNHFRIRPELADAALRLLSDEHRSFARPAGDESAQSESSSAALAQMWADMTTAIESDKAINLDRRPWDAPASQEVLSAIGHTLRNVDYERAIPAKEWRYMSDLTALAADIEAVA